MNRQREAGSILTEHFVGCGFIGLFVGLPGVLVLLLAFCIKAATHQSVPVWPFGLVYLCCLAITTVVFLRATTTHTGKESVTSHSDKWFGIKLSAKAGERLLDVALVVGWLSLLIVAVFVGRLSAGLNIGIFRTH